MLEGQRHDIDSLELKEETTTVRLENFGFEWIVNDKLVASMDPNQSEVPVLKVDPSNSWNRSKTANLITPAFSVKGKVRISDIEYED